MNIAIITTVKHNVGDDFVREGIKFLVKKAYGNDDLLFHHIHKHSPITVRKGYEDWRLGRPSVWLDKLIPKNTKNDYILQSDLVIQSGAPVYWCHEESHCYNNEWFQPLVRDRFKKNKSARMFNLAAGSCQKYHSDGSEFCEKCYKYINEFYGLCEATTVRDTLSKTVLSKVGINVPVIPCSSIFAVDEWGLKSEAEDFVVVNYMKGGSHYTFGQQIDFDRWHGEFKKFYFDMKKREKVIFSCHNDKEVKEALELDPEAEIFHVKDDFLAYMKLYSRAKFGIMNRVHGAFMLASLGKPSIIIGNDSRARMAEEIGLKSYFVNDVDLEILENSYSFLNAGADSFSDRFRLIKEKAFTDYQNALSFG